MLYHNVMAFSNKANVLVFINIFVLAGNWALSAWRFVISPEYIPLHYTVYFGFDRFGPKHDIFLFAALATIIFVVNIFVWRAIMLKNEFWSAFFLVLTLILQLLLLGAPWLVILKTLT